MSQRVAPWGSAAAMPAGEAGSNHDPLAPGQQGFLLTRSEIDAIRPVVLQASWPLTRLSFSPPFRQQSRNSGGRSPLNRQPG